LLASRRFIIDFCQAQIVLDVTGVYWKKLMSHIG